MIDKNRYIMTMALLASFMTVTVTGFLRWLFKPWATEGIWMFLQDSGCRLFGILHRWSGMLFAILALYHIYQHWNEIAGMMEKMRKEFAEVSRTDREAAD